MQKRIFLSAVLSAACALPALSVAAEPTPEWTFAGNMGLSSEYIYRGIGQTDRHPAISGGFDLGHSSGFYIGNWNSSISWFQDATGVSAPIEMDFYGGYKGTIMEDLTFDIGDLYYYYPHSPLNGVTSPNTNEVYGALSYGPFTAKYSYATTNLFGFLTPTGKKTHGSGYFDLSYTGDLGDGLTLGAHVGRQQVKDYGDASYTDYKLSIGKDFSGYVLTAAYIGTNAKGSGPTPYALQNPYFNAYNKDLGANRLVLSVSKSF